MPQRVTRVFLDMDGVLCDFVGASLCHWRRFHKTLIRDVRWGNIEATYGVSEAAFWLNCDATFWRYLPWTREGKALLDGIEALVGRDNVALLSSPCNTPGCCDGKRDWVRREMPAYASRLLLTSAKHFAASPGALLIDDHDANVAAFVAAGGSAVLVPRPWNAGRQHCNDDAGFDVATLLRSVEELVR